MMERLALVNKNGIVLENKMNLTTDEEVSAIFGDSYRLVWTNKEENEHIDGVDMTTPSMHHPFTPLTGDELMMSDAQKFFTERD